MAPPALLQGQLKLLGGAAACSLLNMGRAAPHLALPNLNACSLLEQGGWNALAWEAPKRCETEAGVLHYDCCAHLHRYTTNCDHNAPE